MLYVDIETFCRLDLKKVTPYRYVEDPSFQIILCAWAYDDEPVRITSDASEIPEDVYQAAVMKCAHNAGFERICFSAERGAGYLPPEEWEDTMAIAGERGYPQSLEKLAEALGGEQKSKAGTFLVSFFCRPNKQGKRNLPEDHPEKWAEFVAYCVQDVETLRSVEKRLGGWPTEHERQVWVADQRINDRGIRVDAKMCEAAIAAGSTNLQRHLAEMKELTGLANPNSTAQLLGWLQESGLRSMNNLRAETVAARIASPALASGTEKANRVKRVLELRQETAFTTGKKYLAIAAGKNLDDRLRGQFKFFGAHTGRWSSRGVQLHNLTRASLGSHKVKSGTCSCGATPAGDEHEARENAAEVHAAIIDLLLSEDLDSETLKKLVRATFVVDGVVCDYSAIEARVVAWLAGEEWALQAFRAGRDIYVETAARMSTPGNELTRYQGKVAVLALGYNGSVVSLRAMGGEGTDEELGRLVEQWRAANRNIVRMWGTLGEAFRYGGRVGAYLRVEVQGDDRLIWLPSGRAITYHDVKLDERFRFLDEKTGKWVTRISDGYANPQGGRTMTYGGKLTENVTQAVARDLLAAALVRLENAGFETVGHVHDEVLVAGTQDVDTVSALMCDSPEWATDLPVNSEGFYCYRYRKG